MKLLESLNAHLGIVAGIIASLLVIVPAVRQAFVRLCKALVFMVRAPFILVEKITRMEAQAQKADEFRKQIKEELEVIRHELEFNSGGSTKDFLRRMEQHRQHDLWTKGAPVIETDATGNVVLVSQAACKLFGVSSESDLKRLNWLRFLDGEEVSEFITAFRAMAAAGSGFNYRIAVRDEAGADRGTWEVRAVLIGPRDAHAVYSAQFYPIDDLAKQIAGRNQWAA